MSIKAHIRLSPVEQAFDYILTHMGHTESLNWVATCVAKMEAILPYLTGVHRDSACATHGVSAEAYAWNTCTRVRWDLIVSLITSWIVVTRVALLAYVCRVVRFIPLQGWLLIRISTTPSDMGDDLFTVFKCSNSTFIMSLGSWDEYRLLGSRHDD
jgi:hypothetical protein